MNIMKNNLFSRQKTLFFLLIIIFVSIIALIMAKGGRFYFKRFGQIRGFFFPAKKRPG